MVHMFRKSCKKSKPAGSIFFLYILVFFNTISINEHFSRNNTLLGLSVISSIDLLSILFYLNNKSPELFVLFGLHYLVWLQPCETSINEHFELSVR